MVGLCEGAEDDGCGLGGATGAIVGLDVTGVGAALAEHGWQAQSLAAEEYRLAGQEQLAKAFKSIRPPTAVEIETDPLRLDPENALTPM